MLPPSPDAQFLSRLLTGEPEPQAVPTQSGHLEVFWDERLSFLDTLTGPILSSMNFLILKTFKKRMHRVSSVCYVSSVCCVHVIDHAEFQCVKCYHNTPWAHLTGTSAASAA